MTTLKNKVILVVDDEELIREVFHEDLSQIYSKVLCAENGTVALELMKKNIVDVVISDVRMPGGDGITLVKKIREELEYKPKIFLCTGFTDISAEDAKNLGVIKVFSKPFRMNEVINGIDEALQD